MKILLKLKQGDKFTLPATRYEGSTTTPKSLAGMIISNHVKTQDGSLIAKLPVNIIDAALGKIEIPIDATEWPAGDLISDIKEIMAGDIKHTQTYIIRVDEAVTT